MLGPHCVLGGSGGCSGLWQNSNLYCLHASAQPTGTCRLTVTRPTSPTIGLRMHAVPNGEVIGKLTGKAHSYGLKSPGLARRSTHCAISLPASLPASALYMRLVFDATRVGLGGYGHADCLQTLGLTRSAKGEHRFGTKPSVGLYACVCGHRAHERRGGGIIALGHLSFGKHHDLKGLKSLGLPGSAGRLAVARPS